MLEDQCVEVCRQETGGIVDWDSWSGRTKRKKQQALFLIQWLFLHTITDFALQVQHWSYPNDKTKYLFDFKLVHVSTILSHNISHLKLLITDCAYFLERFKFLDLRIISFLPQADQVRQLSLTAFTSDQTQSVYVVKTKALILRFRKLLEGIHRKSSGNSSW